MAKRKAAAKRELINTGKDKRVAAPAEAAAMTQQFKPRTVPPTSTMYRNVRCASTCSCLSKHLVHFTLRRSGQQLGDFT